MDNNNVITETITYVKEVLENDPSGHDWWHIDRVSRLAAKMSKQLGANEFICTLAALLHDLADSKLIKDEKQGLKNIHDWLSNMEVDQADIVHILDIISSMSYKGGNNQPMKTLEGEIVQDADRLDALGAIGAARTFAYSGSRGRLIYDPQIKLRENMTIDEYRNGKDTAINHFYEKLLKLSELMNTDIAKAIARERHAFLETFLEHFFKEWSGE